MARKPSNAIKTDEHVFIAGITGGGKSYLAENYLANMPRVIKFDTKSEALNRVKKGLNPWPNVDPKELVIVQTLEDMTRVDHPYVIYCPVPEELEQESFNEAFRWIYMTKEDTHTVTWVDELMEVSDNSQSIPKYLKYLFTKGRSRFTPVWGLSQRPTGVHPLCMSQSTHLFCFDLPLDQDRKKVADVTGAKEFLTMPTGYYFWYFRRGWRQAVKGIMQA